MVRTPYTTSVIILIVTCVVVLMTTCNGII